MSQNRPDQRALELDETGSPTPYKVETAFLFSEAAERVEKKAHALLASFRVRGNREWFKCLPRLAAENVLDAADILNLVVLKNEPVLLSQQDLLLREEKKKRERKEEEAKSIRIPLILISLISFLLVFFRSIEPSPAEHVLVKHRV